jgi:hypothetical protein
LLGLRNNSGNSIIHDINDLDSICDEFNALVLWAIEAIYNFMRRLLVLALRLHLVNRIGCLMHSPLNSASGVRITCLPRVAESVTSRGVMCNDYALS